MNKILKAVCGVACAFVFCFLVVGYAALQDELYVNGSVTVTTTPIEISFQDTDAYYFDTINKELVIKDIYSHDGQFYKVTGIQADGFSQSTIYSAVKNGSFTSEIAWSEIESFHIPKYLEKIGDNAFNGYENLKTFTVDENHTSFKVVETVLYGIDDNNQLTKLVRYPSRKTGMYYIVPSSVLSVTAGAFSENAYCKAIVTTHYDSTAWGSGVTDAFMFNPYGSGYDVSSVVWNENESKYVVTFAETPPNGTSFLFQGNIYPNTTADPNNLSTQILEGGTIKLNSNLCTEDGSGNHAQLYLSRYQTYAYGYMNGTTLEIYKNESAVIYGGVYDKSILFSDDNLYNLPSGEDSVEGAEILPGIPSWTTVASSIEKVDIKTAIAPLKVNGWFSEMTNCKEMVLTNLNTTNVNADGKMAGLFSDCSGLDKLHLGEHFGESGKRLGDYNTGLDSVITGWTNNSNMYINGQTVYSNTEILSNKIYMGKKMIIPR